ncbi:hypothetical protein ANRL4_03455 [Anaerolineae bacterium]|nr:hypothetical protein ANRL4_03455 [Anaerolineae bacterium]
MIALIYRLTLRQPVLATALDGDPNSAVSFPYLPGSVLRGAIIRKVITQYGPITTDNEDSRRLFFDGRTRYLNGYLVCQEKRALPTPHSWRADKSPKTSLEHTCYDFAVHEDTSLNREVRVNESFWIRIDGEIKLIEPLRQIAVHTQRARPEKAGGGDYGRARKDSGAVYRYEALAKDQVFEAVILCEDKTDADVLEPLLIGDYFLGGSRSAGYGWSQITLVGRDDHWREVEGQVTLASNLSITLLSHALVRDPYGQFSINIEAVKRAVESRLGAGTAFTAVEARTFMRGTVIGGFNRTWGLPLPQTPAVGMGSVFVFDAPGVSIDQIKALESLGIGERRAEGFGRVAVNWLNQAIYTLQQEKTTTPSAQAERPEALMTLSESNAVAAQMLNRLVRRDLDGMVIEQASKIVVNNPPSASQLSRLRSRIADMLFRNETSGRRLTDSLESIQERKTAARQFDRARVGTKSLVEWIKYTLTNTQWETRWGALNEEIGFEYTLRLIDAVLARSIKNLQKKEREGNENG